MTLSNHTTHMRNLKETASRFAIEGTIADIAPLGSGLINDTYIVTTAEAEAPDYVLQRVNHKVFPDTEGLRRNIETVTAHIRAKLTLAGETDIDRKVLRFIPLADGSSTCLFDGGEYWRMSVLIPRSRTIEAVTPASALDAGKAFGRFQAMLTDLPETLTETIPDFHNMELRLTQLREAVKADPVGRVAEVKPLLNQIEARAEEMCLAERLHRQGVLPRRVCHCDTKVSNMLFDRDSDKVLCVIDLDTVMPSFIFSDFGDFMRTGANTGLEDDPDTDNVEFDMEIFKAFTKGYLEEASRFLLPAETDNLPYAAALFPYMQAVRFLADHINGDTYYKIQYPGHNLVRARAQFKLFQSADARRDEMKAYIDSLLGK